MVWDNMSTIESTIEGRKKQEQDFKEAVMFYELVHPLRIRIANVLAESNSALSSSEKAKGLDMPEKTKLVRNHMMVLGEHGLITTGRMNIPTTNEAGRQVYTTHYLLTGEARKLMNDHNLLSSPIPIGENKRE